MSTTLMTSESHMLTSESVTEGHPDKLCDQISDGVLDAILAEDPMGRVACETSTTTGLVLVAGEISTNTYVDIPTIAREVIREVGYTRAKYGFDCDTCGVIVSIKEQSQDIAQGVNPGGAGDQGMMIGFACNETPELMPMTISLAHKLCRRLAEVRKDGTLPYLRPDGKSQVTVEYSGGVPVRVDTVVLAAQHDPSVSQPTIQQDLIQHVVKEVIPGNMLDERTFSSITSTPPAGSRLAARWGTRVSRDGRSSWTPTAAWHDTGAAPSPARTRRRLTARPATPPDTLPRTWLLPDLPTESKCNSLTLSASPIPHPCGGDLRNGQSAGRPDIGLSPKYQE